MCWDSMVSNNNEKELILYITKDPKINTAIPSDYQYCRY